MRIAFGCTPRRFVLEHELFQVVESLLVAHFLSHLVINQKNVRHTQ